MIAYFFTRYKRCDQIEERKARRLSGRVAPKGNYHPSMKVSCSCDTCMTSGVTEICLLSLQVLLSDGDPP